jgi:hypothetical protein
MLCLAQTCLVTLHHCQCMQCMHGHLLVCSWCLHLQPGLQLGMFCKDTRYFGSLADWCALQRQMAAQSWLVVQVEALLLFWSLELSVSYSSASSAACCVARRHRIAGRQHVWHDRYYPDCFVPVLGPAHAHGSVMVCAGRSLAAAWRF